MQSNELTPKIIDFQKAVTKAVISVDESSVQDSSLRNDFSEYRDILRSGSGSYSDKEGYDDNESNQEAVLDSIIISPDRQAESRGVDKITEEVAAEDRATPVPRNDNGTEGKRRQREVIGDDGREEDKNGDANDFKSPQTEKSPT